MQFSRILATAMLALAPFVSAQATSGQNAFTSFAANTIVQAGNTVNLHWTDLTPGTVTLQLRYGNPGALDQGTVIASHIANSGSYSWQVPAGITGGPYYAVEIIDDSNPTNINYSHQFQIMSSVTGDPATLTGSATASGSMTSAMTASSASMTSTGSMSMTSMMTSSGMSTMSTMSTMTTGSMMTMTSSAMSGQTTVATETGAAAALNARCGGAMAALIGAGVGAAMMF